MRYSSGLIKRAWAGRGGVPVGVERDRDPAARGGEDAGELRPKLAEQEEGADVEMLDRGGGAAGITRAENLLARPGTPVRSAARRDPIAPREVRIARSRVASSVLSTTETPVGSPARTTIPLTSTPAAATASSWIRPSASSPTAAISAVPIP
ncbi:MAG: hypothetical protein U0R24_03635 [Solirubrobacterales bacterium]